jgi:hypothetical protein
LTTEDGARAHHDGEARRSIRYEIQEAGTMRELIEELKRREKGQTASDAAAH